MLQGIINRVFGTRHERELKRVRPILDAITEHYERLQAISDEELRRTLNEGAEKARAIAEVTMRQVKERMGIVGA